MKNKVLLASFINKDVVNKFVGFLCEKNKVKKDNVFIYEIEDNEYEYLVTFKYLKDDKIDLTYVFNNAIPVNIKNGCIFSINGLNSLIKHLTDNEFDKKYVIDWEEYRGKLVLNKNNKVSMSKITKIN